MSRKASGKSKQKFERDLLDYAVTAQTRKSKKNSWLTYGAASSVALLASSGVEAAIIHSGPQNISLGGFSFTQIDIDNDGAYDLGFSAFTSGVTFSVFSVGNGAQIQSDGIGNLANLSFGQSVGTPGSSLGFGASFVFSYGVNFAVSSPGFIGAQLGSGNFAWIQVHTVTGSADLEIVDWAYDDSGAHIAAGATTSVPEPSTLMLLGMGMLAMGATGVRNLRRRKREAVMTDEVNAAA